MKILKYTKDINNYCLVHKTRLFIHYLVNKNNKFYYYFSFNVKNYSKTNQICKKFLSSKELIVELKNYDSYDLINKYNNYKYKSDYNIVMNAYGEEGFVNTKIYNKEKEIVSFKEFNKSPCIIGTYIFYLFDCPYSSTFHGSMLDSFFPYIKKFDDKTDRLILRYLKYVFNKFIDYNFNIKSNFELFEHSGIDFKNKYYLLIYKQLDKTIKINKEKILKRFKINSQNELFGYIYYYMSFIYDIYYKYYLSFIDKKDLKITLTNCAFNNEVWLKNTKSFIKQDNLIFSQLNFKKYLIFFTEPGLEQYLFLTENCKIPYNKYYVQ